MCLCRCRSVWISLKIDKKFVYLRPAYVVCGKVMFLLMSVSQSVILSVHSGVPTIQHTSWTCWQSCAISLNLVHGQVFGKDKTHTKSNFFSHLRH